MKLHLLSGGTQLDETYQNALARRAAAAKKLADPNLQTKNRRHWHNEVLAWTHIARAMEERYGARGSPAGG
jgi:hypothetical protein